MPTGARCFLLPRPSWPATRGRSPFCSPLLVSFLHGPWRRSTCRRHPGAWTPAAPHTVWPWGGPLPPCRSFFTRRMGVKPHAQLGASTGLGFTQRRVRSPVGRRLGRGSGSPGAAWPDPALWGPLGGQGSGALGLDVASFSSWHPWAELGSPVVGLHPREALRPPTSRPLGVSPGHVTAEPHGVGMARPWPGSHSPSQAQASCPASPQRGRCAHASQPGYGVPPSRQAGTRLRDRCALTPQRGPGTQPSGS